MIISGYLLQEGKKIYIYIYMYIKVGIEKVK